MKVKAAYVKRIFLDCGQTFVNLSTFCNGKREKRWYKEKGTLDFTRF